MKEGEENSVEISEKKKVKEKKAESMSYREIVMIALSVVLAALSFALAVTSFVCASVIGKQIDGLFGASYEVLLIIKPLMIIQGIVFLFVVAISVFWTVNQFIKKK